MNKQEIIRQHFSEMGKKSASKLTVEERKERAIKAVRAREAKREAKELLT